MQVDVMQYLKPDGRQTPATVELPDAHKKAYQRMIDSGCRFEAEVLTTGEVSMTVSDGEEDIDINVSENGPLVLVGMSEMLERELWLTAPFE